MRQRSERRAERERMKARAKRVFPHHNPGKYADNLKKCSCWMCGNLRKQEGASIQERRFYCEVS